MISYWLLVISFSSLWAEWEKEVIYSGEELHNSFYSSGIYGIIDSDTTWSDTVNVIGDVVVASHTTLTLKPGTCVRLSGNSVWDTSNGYNGVCDILVFGRVILKGTEQDTITFTSIDTSSRWGSLHFISPIADTIEYLQLSNGIVGISVDSVLNLCIKNCGIINFKGRDGHDPAEYGGGIYCIGDSVSITECRIENICGGDAGGDYGVGGKGIAIVANVDHLEVSFNKVCDCFGGDGTGREFEESPGGPGIGLMINCNTGIIRQNHISNCKGGEPEGSGIGIQISNHDSLVIKENDICNKCGYNLCNGSADTIDATYNYWGFVEELEIFNRLLGPIRYSPWTDSTHSHLYYTYAVQGEIPKDTTWGEKVLVIKDVVIPEGISLGIEPGTEVAFASEREGKVLSLTVYGKLKAVGTSQQPIRFTASGRWGCISFKGDEDDTLKHVEIENNRRVSIVCESASPYISNCKISNCHGWDDRSTHSDNPGSAIGISCIKGAKPTIINNYITNLRGGSGVRRGADAIGIFCSSSSPLIKNNIIDGIHGGGVFVDGPWGDGIGILCNSSSPEIVNNIIKNISRGKGFSSFKTGKSWREWEIGIHCIGNSAPKITRNIIDFGEIYGRWKRAVVCEDSSKPIIGGSPEDQNDFLRRPPLDPYEPMSWPMIINYTPNNIIATYNWWGVTDPDTISLMIIDHNDNPQYGYVLFEPWAEDSLGISESHRRAISSLQIYPNPTYASCVISYSLTTPTYVRLNIYNALGQCVHTLVDRPQESGYYKVNWDGRDERSLKLPAGVYFLRMETKNFKVTKKVVVLK